MDKPDGNIIEAVSVALVEDGQVLLVRRGREPAKGMYAFPGGRVKADEPLEQAARRELIEETGMIAGGLREIDELLIAATDTASPDYRLHVFTGRPSGGALQANDDAAWAGWCRLADLAAIPVTVSTLTICRQLLDPHFKQK